MNIVLLTPLVEEQEALSAALSRVGHIPVSHRVGRLLCARFPAMALTLAVGGHGKAQFALQTQHLLDHGAADLVICAGAAGSLCPDIGVGDIVAATHTVEHDYTLRFVRRPLPRFTTHAGALDGLKQAHARTQLPFRLHFGPIASGDEDVVCSVRAAELARKTEALCVAWEGSGAARACLFSGVPFLELRCVTDQADKSAAQDFDVNLALCMENLARLLCGWLIA
jgi:adenosylhomocysteine nucleosidase